MTGACSVTTDLVMRVNVTTVCFREENILTIVLEQAMPRQSFCYFLAKRCDRLSSSSVEPSLGATILRVYN